MGRGMCCLSEYNMQEWNQAEQLSRLLEIARLPVKTGRRAGMEHSGCLIAVADNTRA
jgi:hypothetical protein